MSESENEVLNIENLAALLSFPKGSPIERLATLTSQEEVEKYFDTLKKAVEGADDLETWVVNRQMWDGRDGVRKFKREMELAMTLAESRLNDLRAAAAARVERDGKQGQIDELSRQLAELRNSTNTQISELQSQLEELTKPSAKAETDVKPIDTSKNGGSTPPDLEKVEVGGSKLKSANKVTPPVPPRPGSGGSGSASSTGSKPVAKVVVGTSSPKESGGSK